MANLLEKELITIQQLLVDGNQALLKEKVNELRSSDHEDTLSYLLKAIEHNRIDDSMTLVKDLLRQNQQVAVFYDPKVGALKVELNYQDSELNKLELQRDDLTKKINLFHSKYMFSVGAYIEKALYLRLQKLRIQVKQNPDLQPILDQAEKEFEEFNSYRECSKDGIIYQLSDEKQKKLKRLYRKASLICHPDKVKEEHKEKAEEIFSKITLAYKRNDLKKVESIANYLEKSGGFDLKIDDYDNIEYIKDLIEAVMIRQEETKDEIVTIQDSTAYYTVNNIEGSWEDYFEMIKANHKNQIKELENWIEQNK